MDAGRMLGASYAWQLMAAIDVPGLGGHQPAAHISALLGGEFTVVDAGRMLGASYAWQLLAAVDVLGLGGHQPAAHVVRCLVVTLEWWMQTVCWVQATHATYW